MHRSSVAVTDSAVQIMANSMPEPGDGGSSHTFSYALSGLTLSDTPEKMAGFIVLATQRQMRDYRLPETYMYHAMSKNLIKRRLVIEDRFL